MAIGPSGRIVVDIDPLVKRALRARLAGDGRHLKEWFLECVDTYLNTRADSDRSLPLVNAAPRWHEPTMLKAAERVTTYSKGGSR